MPETSDSFGEYLLLERLNQSRTGIVYNAKHRTMGRLVALKVLSKQASQAPGFVKRFQRKTKILAQLNHPNLVAAYEAGESADTPYLVMEYVDGQNLSTLLKSRGPLPYDEAINYLLQTAAGLG